jgi:hypothetical protein
MATEHCNTSHAAAILETDEGTLRYWRRLRKGPPFRKFGKLVRYHIPTLLAWAEQQTQQ